MIGIVLTIWLFLYVAGQLREGTILAGLAFVVLGAIFPPVALPVGAVILAYLFLRQGVGDKVLSWAGSLGTQTGSTPRQPIPPLTGQPAPQGGS